MKREAIKAVIVGLVLLGAALLGSLAGIGQEGSLGAGLSIGLGGLLFFGFLGLIVAFQLAPAVVLFGMLVKEVFKPSAKAKKDAGAAAGEGS